MKKKKHHRRLLWLLLVFPLIIALGLILYRLSETGRHVRAIQAHGGIATERYAGPDWYWLERFHFINGFHMFNEIIAVSLGSEPEGAAKKYLGYSGIVNSISYPSFDNHDLAELAPTFASLGPLEELGISDCEVTNEGLKNLAVLNGVKFLYLLELPITDEGLKHIRKIKGLQRLEIVGCDVSQEALDEFERKTGVMVIGK